MFPLPWNKEYRKKDGSLSTLEEVMQESGGSDIPDYTIEDAGKVLTVGDDGELVWDDAGTPTFTRATWNSMTTEEKKTYGLVAIVDNNSGYERGEVVNGANYREYLPYSTNNILAETGDFEAGSSTWGDFTWADSTKPTANQDGSVETNGSNAYYSLGADNTSCTMYQIAKSAITSSSSGRWLDCSKSNSQGNASCIYRNTTDLKCSKYGYGDEVIMSNCSTSYSVQVMIVDRTHSITTFIVAQGNNVSSKDLNPLNTGDKAIIGGGIFENEASMSIVYGGVVQGAESLETVMKNIGNLLTKIPN